MRDSLPIDMLLSAVSVLVVAQSNSEIPEGLMNNPVFLPMSCKYNTCFGLRPIARYTDTKILTLGIYVANN